MPKLIPVTSAYELALNPVIYINPDYILSVEQAHPKWAEGGNTNYSGCKSVVSMAYAGPEGATTFYLRETVAEVIALIG